ncbi:hypothetical protein KA001_00520 [Patescibacteria group bacterium]|nr:hypothetical protein [Patescibacteria group bacterium]
MYLKKKIFQFGSNQTAVIVGASTSKTSLFISLCNLTDLRKNISEKRAVFQRDVFCPHCQLASSSNSVEGFGSFLINFKYFESGACVASRNATNQFQNRTGADIKSSNRGFHLVSKKFITGKKYLLTNVTNLGSKR